MRNVPHSKKGCQPSAASGIALRPSNTLSVSAVRFRVHGASFGAENAQENRGGLF